MIIIVCDVIMIVLKINHFTYDVIIKMIQQIKSFLKLDENDLKQPVILKKKENVYFLVLNTKANTFTHKFTRDIKDKLKEVIDSDGPVSLVTVSLSKLFSGGLDLKYASNLQSQDQRYFVTEVIGLFGIICSLPFPTFAFVKGAAYAGGCMLSFCHDFIYVAGNGSFCCNQADIGLHLPPGMMEVIKKKHNSHNTLRDMVVLAKKFTAKQAKEIKMIDDIFEESTALQTIFERAEKASNYGQNRQNMKKIKGELHKTVIDACFNKQQAPGTVGEIAMVNLPKL